MDQDKDRVIRIVKKLYALANSSDSEESKAAAEKAHALCAEYSLTVSVEDLQIPAAGTLCREHTCATKEHRQHRWMALLCSAVMDGFSCDAVVSRHAGRISYIMIGVEPDVSVAMHTFVFLYRTIATGRWGNSKQTLAWRLGFATEIYNRLRSRKRCHDTQGNAGALVPLKAQIVASYMSEQFPNLGKPRRYKEMGVDAEAFGAGVRAGNSVPLNEALNSERDLEALA